MDGHRTPDATTPAAGAGNPAAEPRSQAVPSTAPEHDSAESNRGQRAPATGSGDAVGSGASAGGGGGAEEYDVDPQAGGGKVQIRSSEPTPSQGGDAPQHNSR